MTKRHNLAGLTKWMERDPWHYHFLDVMAEHTAEACEEAGITVPAVADVLGQQAAMVVWGAAFEDFLTRPYGEDARTVVDDYLKRRGWKETPVNRCYMEAVRDSVMSLYEVSAIIPDESFLARDLIRGGDLLRISERSATTMLKPWDRIAARIVDVNGKTMMTGGTLVLDHETADSLVEHFSASPEAVRQKFRELANKTAELVGFDLGDLVNHRVVLGISAHEFTLAWLKDSLRRALHPPKVVNCDGDAIAFHTVRYPLAAGAAADAVRVWLRGNDALREESDTFWNWVEYDSTSPRRPGDAQTFITKMADGATVLGTIKLIENALVLQVNSEARAVRGQAMLAPLLVELERYRSPTPTKRKRSRHTSTTTITQCSISP